MTWRNLDLTWTAGSNIRVFLERNLLVGNLTGTGETSVVVSSTKPKAAQPFTTGSHAGGYSLSHISLYFAASTSGVTPKVSIYEDDGETPLHTLSNPGSIPLTAEVLDFTAEEVLLKPNTTYWLVLDMMSGTGTLSVGLEESDDEFVPSLLDWSIADSGYENDGTAWAQTVVSGVSPVFQMEVRGRSVSHNFPVQGKPEVSGVLQPGMMAYADTASVSDSNGADPAAFGYEWVLVDVGTMTVQEGETGNHYTIQPGDVGKRLIARVSFVDDAGFTETVTSNASPEVSAASSYLVSNLSQTKSGTVGTQSTAPRLANSFTIGGNPVVLEGVHLRLAADTGAELRVSIYSHDSAESLPDSRLLVFTNPSAMDDSVDSVEEFTIGLTKLSATTTYWLVVERVSGEEEAVLAYTTSGAETSDHGVEIGPETYTELNEAWAPGTNDIVMFGLLGKALNVPASFPSAAETLGVDENSTSVSVGTVAVDQGDNDPLTYSLAGPGLAAFNDHFALNEDTGEFAVKADATIDFETRSSYGVTLQVTDNREELGRADPAIDDTVDVTINVNNVEEPGTVMLDPSAPQLDMQLTATLSDPDGGVTRETWQWQSAASADGPFSNIDGATAASFTPRQEELDRFLKARVSYTDGQGSGKSAEGATDQFTVFITGMCGYTGAYLTIGDPFQVRIGPREDIDALKIELTAGSNGYRVSLRDENNGQISAESFYFGLVHPDNEWTQYVSYDYLTNWETARDSLFIIPERTGTYCVEIRAKSGSFTGDYTVLVDNAEDPLDRPVTGAESNSPGGDAVEGIPESSSNFHQISIGTDNAVTGEIQESQDRDWYIAKLENGLYRVTVEGFGTGKGTLKGPGLRLRQSDTREFVPENANSAIDRYGSYWVHEFEIGESSSGSDIFHFEVWSIAGNTGTYTIAVEKIE